jgi:uncharacterized protein (TIGR02147 family)
MQKEYSISVYDYTDYRKYLFDYYQNQKKQHKAFSYRYFARKAEINSIGLYRDVVEGRQSLGRSLILKFSQALRHTKNEASYFENMVYFNEAKTIDERKMYFGRMMSFGRSKAFKIDAGKYEYYSRWYYSAVRALLTCFRFQDDFESIAKALDPPIRPDQAKKALEVLGNLGFIKKDAEGYYELDKAVITTGILSDDQKVNTLNVINFQKTMMQMAQDMYERHPFQRLSMSTLTMSVSKQTFSVIKDEIAALREKIAAMAEKDANPDRIYQLSYQLFPLSRIKEDE